MSDLKQIAALDLEKQLTTVTSTLLKEQQASCPVVHRFGPGVYIREVFLPAGSLVVGHYHKKEHLNMMLQGSMLLLKGNGEIEQLEAPACLTAPPGRKVAYILNDVVWQNIYATNKKDVATLEEELFDMGDFKVTLEDMRAFSELEQTAITYDYLEALDELGLTPEFVDEVSRRTEDLIDFPDGSYKVGVFNSYIEGKGLFATGDIASGDIIAPARLGGMRTPAGRYANHSPYPNAIAQKMPNGDIIFVATRDIEGMHGGILGEEITLNYRQVLKINLGEALCQES
jgi:hypothetical protein